MQTRKWEDKDGADRYTTEVVIPAFAPIEALMKLSFDNDNNKGGDRDDDRGSRGSSRGGSSRSRDDRGGDDDRGSSRGGRSSRRDDERGGSRGRGRDDRDNDRGGRDDRDPPRRAAAGKNADLEDDIPFLKSRSDDILTRLRCGEFY
jgi:single-strand DNA-binding protein